MQRECFAMDLKNDPALIAEYEAWHTKVWPEVLAHGRRSGIASMEIYRIENRLFMITEVDDDFDPASRSNPGAGNPKVEEWEELMWTFQQALPWAKPCEKWLPMTKIFEL
ncbi:L-rhamnose mutarotase [Kordiimonas sp. SCSIO 12610]|uniref:L-rhamnose mutarotase n=1 Tax=Kordiimonas sp. SCSIO 12610 TaxID=2829597 RepID=UPI00210D1617|nr:L-rhamnose mutarotase [Kordiimonas sp. SCSIO 12610]UTW54682.1 L-rhamnose mutarotase [Kordiimonas sp. SCSIO 12610]